MSTSPLSPEILRHKTAIHRTDISRPVRLAMEAGLLGPGASFFDYGCGHGGDIERLAAIGVGTSGWDPYYRSDLPRTEADIVNLGYVINVIEAVEERSEALVQAWALARKVLIVAAQVIFDDPGKALYAYGDGVVTSRNTFQKYYEQEELKRYIDMVLGVDSVPAGLGVYLVFRDEPLAEVFRASRFRRRLSTPKVRSRVKRFEDYQELLAPLIAFVSERGRLPIKSELPAEPSIAAKFGSLVRAFKLIQQATGTQEWENIFQERRQDLILYSAFSRFDRRPRFSQLSSAVQNDIKALFGSYRQTCEEADQMLFSLGRPGVIAERCRASKIGKLLPDALYVHVSALDSLDPLLRLYEGCASRTIGRMDGATLVKFSTMKPQISYLYYPNFDNDPHPALHASIKIRLPELRVNVRNYDLSENPPILHRKETFVTPSYPHYEKLAKLTRQEVDWGLLDNPRHIGTRKDWIKRLEENCAEFQGYRLVRRKDASEYRLRVLRAACRNRQRRRSTEDP